MLRGKPFDASKNVQVITDILKSDDIKENENLNKNKAINGIRS